MAKPGTTTLRKFLSGLATIVITLLAAECLTMLAVSPFMSHDKGYIVAAGLIALPLWAILLTLAYTVDGRARFLLALLFSSLATGLYFLL